ncbi:hypothetical protein Hypma_016195 [Hypsizygus marmoreus]|uniref:Uncharacterized protein n=1 Tax=Hypsizygus marmoreus TaxID=39966 RepID=A0A369J0N1_HYPMA|nr:hypothetical protein Hypma_016195 [Hypsizygus marmoreus]
MDEAQTMRTGLLTAVADISMASMALALPDVYDNMKMHADLVNTPRLGNNSNFAYATAQLNVAAAKSLKVNLFYDVLETTGNSLRGEMGQFGGEHCDAADNPGYFTTHVVDSSILRATTRAIPLFNTLASFVTLHPATASIFSGCRFHVGFTATRPPGETPAEDAYRFVIVSYPPTG